MNITIKFLFIIKALIIAGLVLWGVFLVRDNSELKLKNYELEENYKSLKAFTEVLKYDLGTSRDSVRILEKELNNR